MASNEMPCAASVVTKIAPMSSLGRNPVGMILNRNAVSEKNDAGSEQGG